MPSHYREREEFFDKAIVVFRRGDAVSQGENRYWWARLRISDHIGYKTVSLKTRVYVDAVARAKNLYLQLSQTVKDGGSLDANKSFEKAWLAWYEMMVANNAWSESRKKWYINYYNRYWKSYFQDKKLDQISESFANEYFDWRRSYWSSGDGVNSIEYNRRRKGMKTSSSHNIKREPSYKTLEMEKSALNQFFTYCYSTKRFIRYPIKLKVIASARQKREGRRASFTTNEWAVLTRNLHSWAFGKGKYADGRLNSFHKHQRQQLRFYVLFLGSTGIRSGSETRFMKWEDLSSFKDSDGQECLKIHIRAETKMGRSRVVISQPNCVAWLKEWRSISHYNKDQDYVFYGQSKVDEPQKVATDFNKTFQAFLKTVEYKGRDLLFDADGGRRSLYSCRHFYAGQRLLHNVSYEDLRRNLGTGIGQLIHHYDHILAEQRAKEITKFKQR